jgi:hypothetical protein
MCTAAKHRFQSRDERVEPARWPLSTPIAPFALDKLSVA